MSRLADVSVAIQEWAVSALTGSQELADALAVPLNQVANSVWDSPPSADVTDHFILLQVTEPRDIGGVGMTEVMATGLLTAKVVGRAESYDPLSPIASAIHSALHGKANVPLAGGGTMLSSRRVRAIAYPESAQGVEYRHLGGLYEVSAQ